MDIVVEQVATDTSLNASSSYGGLLSMSKTMVQFG